MKKIKSKQMYVPCDVIEELDKVKAFYKLDSYADAMRRMVEDSKPVRLAFRLINDLEVDIDDKYK